MILLSTFIQLTHTSLSPIWRGFAPSFVNYKKGCTPLATANGLPKNSYKPIINTGGFASSFVNYKKGCIRLAAASDKVYQLLAHGRWFSPGTPASSTTKTGIHVIAESGVKCQKSINHKPSSFMI